MAAFLGDEAHRSCSLLLSLQSWQGSVDSQLDLLSLQEKSAERKPSLSRSLTDSNITYQGEEMQEAQGSTCYITKEGDMDYQVVLKAVHAASMRESPCCTLRVCEVILNLLELLVDLGVLKPPTPPETPPAKDQATNTTATTPGAAAPTASTSAAAVAATTTAASAAQADQTSQNSDQDSAKESKKGPDRFNTAHCLMLNTVLR